MQHTDDQILELLKTSSVSKKSSKEISNLIRLIFEDPASLSNKFTSTERQNPDRSHPHNLDLSLIENLYKSVKSLGKNAQIASCLDKSFARFQQQGQLKAFLQSNKQLKYFFILILWDDLFTDSANRLLMRKCINLVAHSGTYRGIMSQWMDDLKPEKMGTLTYHMHDSMETEFPKLLPNVIDPTMIKYVEINVKNSCLFLAQLHQSNGRAKRIPAQAFINQKIANFFEPVGQYKLHLKKMHELNFLDYPFLLPLEYKQKILEIESMFEQKVNMQKSMQMGLQGLMAGNPHLDPNGGFSLQALIFLHFTINRNNILDDSLEKLGKVTQNLKSPMRISFIGEEGADEGGVKNEYFQLIIKQIFNPYLDMFIPKNNGRTNWFNGYSYEPPIRFQFVGMLFGLAIYNSVLLNVQFPQALYRKLLQPASQNQDFSPQVLQDLSGIQPEIYSGLKKILEETGSLQNLQLSFNIEFQHFGQKLVQQLVEDGSSIKVTQDNKSEYVQLYADYLLNKHTRKQFKAFKHGFNRVVTGEMIHLLEPEELQNIICGSPNIDFKELQLSTSYEGFTENSVIIKNLWNILHSLTLEDKKAFLIFVTGTDRVPLEGLKALKFLVQKHGANTNHLPTAHTCFNVFLLPQYESKAILQQKVRMVLKHNQGFGLI